MSNQPGGNRPPDLENETTDDVFDKDNDDLISISIFGTTALKQAGYAFIVHGFGQSPWPVDIDYDGAIVIEQLPALLSGLSAGRDVVIDFPGQGIERKIEVRQADDENCILTCSSITSWQPAPAQEFILKSNLVRMLTTLGIDFFSSLRELDSRWTEFNCLKGWESGQF